MIVLQAQKINKSFGEQEVLRDISLSIQAKERVGLVGVNGAGKSTLLKCLTGLLPADSGELSLSSNLSIGYLEQLAAYADGATIWDAMLESFAGILELRGRLHELEKDMSRGGPELGKIMERYARFSEEYELANGYACENTARRILSGLGFRSEDYEREAQSLSGGQKTRLNLGRLLARNPDLLCLDEPTNHLDMASVEWLEEFIKNYSGTILVVSHDRRFLDRVATRILDLRLGQMSSYEGNYSQYLIKKAAADLAWQRAYDKQQEYIHETEAYIRRFKAGIKSKQARGRQSQLQRLERINTPQQEKALSQHALKLSQESGQDVLRLRGVSKSFGSLQLFNNLDLIISKGEKIALIGPNGCGKTTLLKIITDRLAEDEGELRIGSRVEIGYFGQEYEDLESKNSMLDEIMSASQLTLEEARTALGTMLFSGDDVFKRVGDLSGGEKGRLAFLKLLLSGANFLILDEPTNHLDIESCEMVEKMLQDYDGTVLLVSHDRYFIDQVVDRLLCLNEGRLESYLGNYSYYQEKLQTQMKQDALILREAKQYSLRPEILEREQEKERQRIHRRRVRDLEAIENRIMELESQKSQLENQLSDPLTYSDEEKARVTTASYKQTEELLASAYEDWEILNQELEE